MNINHEQIEEFCKSFYPNWIVINDVNKQIVRNAYKKELYRIFGPHEFGKQPETIPVEVGIYVSSGNQTDLGVTDAGLLVARSLEKVIPTNRVSFGRATKANIKSLIENLERLLPYAVDPQRLSTD